jgi:DNA mismatch repair protein MutS2
VDDTTLEALEYPQVLRELKGFTSTPLGAESVQKLRPSKDFFEVEEAFKELKEVSSILNTSGGFPLGGVSDIRHLLGNTGPEGAYLQPSELLDVKNNIDAISSLKSDLTPAFTRSFPLISTKIESFSDYTGLLKELEGIVDESGCIKDDASSVLLSLRRDIRTTRQRARAVVEGLSGSKNLREFLRDDIFTISDDRYVLCVAAGHHTRLPGVVHGRSGSGLTYYIEPFQAVELNNRLAILKKEEKAEEVEILKRGTELVSYRVDEILMDLKTVAALDLVQAKARFKEYMNAVLPVITTSSSYKGLRLINARHPLLVFKEFRGGEPVVSVDIILEKGCSVLVISGANAGGKTVALKTLGLLSLMVNSGLAIPVDQGSEVVLFNDIFADIGDRQNIAECLSTFSAHLKRTGEILDKSGPGTLVLIDEIGVGTDPSEGGALALTVLEALKDRGARVAVTTHLNLLKAHAHSDRSFQNASVVFDEKTLKPFYTLRYGMPGASLGLTVARSLGISEELIERAAEKLKGDEGAFVESIEALEREKRSLRVTNERLEELEVRKGKALDRLRRDRDLMLEKAREKVDAIVKGAGEEIREIAARMKQKGIKANRGGGRKAVSDVRGRVIPLLSGPKVRFVPEVGDVVDIEGTGTRGEVINVDGDGKKAELLVGGMKVWVARERLMKGPRSNIRPLKPIPSRQKKTFIETEAPTSVNLIGMRVDEALRVLARVLDRAHMEGIERVEVIHGVGTGQLAKAVAEYLKTNGLVKGFGSGDLVRGGGVTVVEIA